MAGGALEAIWVALAASQGRGAGFKVAQPAVEQWPQCPRGRQSHEALRLLQHLCRDSPSGEPLDQPVCEVVAVVGADVVDIAVEMWPELVYDEVVHLLLTPERSAERNLLLRLAKGRLGRRIVEDLAAVVVLLAKDVHARVPEAFQPLAEQPRRQGRCGSVGQVVEIQCHLLLPPAKAVNHELGVAHAVRAVEVHGRRDVPGQGLGVRNRELGVGNDPVMAVGAEVPLLSAVGVHDVLELERALVARVGRGEDALELHEKPRVVLQDIP
mmetsp:Transcript_108562/g.317636  ORF Transcript_108562/g.317636 Transcript_108562/m.317636 type:complete len:269 (-) Transcript_108562:384-1190(-)